MPVNRLFNASQAPRCQHVKVNGCRCGAPARHGRSYCCFHDSAARRNGEFVLPIIEDAASLQLALNKILQALVDKSIGQKTASILLYGLQIAFANLKQLKGERRLDEVERQLQARYEAERQQEQERAERESSDNAKPTEDQPAEVPAAAAEPTEPPPPASPVDEFLRQFNNRPSPISNGPNDESQFTNGNSSQDQDTFDIQACADAPDSSVPLCLSQRQQELHDDRSTRPNVTLM